MWDLCGLRHPFYLNEEGSLEEALRRFPEKIKVSFLRDPYKKDPAF